MGKIKIEHANKKEYVTERKRRKTVLEKEKHTCKYKDTESESKKK